MIRFQRILFPADFSPQCLAVIPAVHAMARRFDSELTVLHVVDLPVTWFGAPESAAWSALISADRLRADGSLALDRFILEHFAKFRAVPYLAEGEAARQIIDYVDEHPVDLIMMPTRGYGAFRRLLLGSSTAKILHDAHCPVWTGVHAEELAAHPPEGWKKMVCAIEADPRDLPVLRWADQFAREQNVELRLVHAVEGAEAMLTPEDHPMYQFLLNTARERVDKLQAEAGTNLEVCLRTGRAGVVVHQAAVGLNADLIIIGRGVLHDHLGGLRSSAYSIIREAPCPVISV